jgi:hypothetical protein
MSKVKQLFVKTVVLNMPNGKDNATPAKNGIQLLKKSFKKKKTAWKSESAATSKAQNLYE